MVPRHTPNNTNEPTAQFPRGEVLSPEEMRATGTHPRQAMRDLVTGRTNTALTFTELAPGVWEVDSNQPGPRCVLLGGNHGNEPAGVSAVMRLLHEYAVGGRELPRGKVVLAIGNEDAVMANQRVECGQHDTPRTAEIARATAEAFLNAYLAAGRPSLALHERFVVEFCTVVPKEDETFSFARRFTGFDTVSRGELVGSGVMGDHRAQEDCVIIFPTDPTRVKIGADLYFLGKKLDAQREEREI